MVILCGLQICFVQPKGLIWLAPDRIRPPLPSLSQQGRPGPGRRSSHTDLSRSHAACRPKGVIASGVASTASALVFARAALAPVSGGFVLRLGSPADATRTVRRVGPTGWWWPTSIISMCWSPPRGL